MRTGATTASWKDPGTARPRVVSTVEALGAELKQARQRGSVGLVPTMGALHAGHLSLIRAARAECGYVVVSVFVNATQFGPNEDLARYPRDLEADVRHCGDEKVDLVFAPADDEVYPPGYSTFVEVQGISDVWEGAFRPGHFRGVATVVLKLLNLVAPDVAYFGQKDYQQSLVVRRMAADLNVKVAIRVCPTVREPDGLALSSRNQYLTPSDRQRALVLYHSLILAKELYDVGERDADKLREPMHELFRNTQGVGLDYAEIVSSESLEKLAAIDGPAIALVAARVGGTRLIDNLLLASSDNGP